MPAFRDKDGNLFWTEVPTWAHPEDAPFHRPEDDCDEPLYERDEDDDIERPSEEDDVEEVSPEYHGGTSFVAASKGGRKTTLRGEDIPGKPRTAWAARGGGLENLLDTLGVAPLRLDIRISLSAYCRAIYRDSRCDARTRDLLREYLMGPE